MWVDSLEKTLMLGGIGGRRRRGRQRMSWLDGITDSNVNLSKNSFLLCLSGGVPDLRVQRYDFFLNHQNFSKKKSLFSCIFYALLIYVNTQNSLHLIIYYIGRAVFAKSQEQRIERMKRIFLPQIARMIQVIIALICKKYQVIKINSKFFCIFICRFIRKSIPLHADLKEKA